MLWETVCVIELKTDQHSVKTQAYSAYIIHSLGTAFFSAFVFIFFSHRPAGDEEQAGRVCVAELMAQQETFHCFRS